MKKTPLKRRKSRSKLAILKDKAWTVFSKYIRERDKNCVTCKTGKAENAGHFWHGKLDYDEININGQCVRCNKWLSGNLNEYAIYLIQKHGLKAFFDLYDRKNMALRGEKYTEAELEEIIAKYGQK